MNNYNQINPYMRNAGVIKRFFAKKITLLIAIACTAAWIFNFAASIFDSISQGTAFASFDILSVMTIIGFFMLWFLGRSRKDNVSFKAALNLLWVPAVIEIVLLGLCLIIFLIAAAFSSLIDLDVALSEFVTFISAYVLPSVIISILQSSAMLVLIGSFKKSQSSIYLYKRGAVFFGITSLLLALTSLALIISYLTFYPDMINNLSNALFYVSGSGDFDISGDLLSGYTSYNIYISSVSELLKLIVSVMLSVFGFSYNRYIKGLSESIKSGSRAVNDSPTDRAVQIPSDNVPEFVSPTHPLSFEPQPVFGAQTDASPQAAPADEYQAPEGSADAAEPNPYITQNPYANQNNNSRNSYAKQKRPQEGSDCLQTIVCPECGSECPSNTLFCGNCGKNLRR